jgi:hypothetical protein
MRTSRSAGTAARNTKWVRFPYAASSYRLEGEKLARQWKRLHQGDCELYPDTARVSRAVKQSRAFSGWLEAYGKPEVLASALQDAWREFHAGDFGAAIDLGSTLGPLGASVANKAAGVYVTYLEKKQERALEILQAAIRRGEEAIEMLPDDPNAHYMLAFVLGRYAQRISVLQALANGIAGRVRMQLEHALRLEPRHADAHIAYGLYHAEIVAKLGALPARLTYGASQSVALEHLERALKLAPASAIARVEYANALLLLDAKAHGERARKLYAEAAACKPGDAMERLDVERARSHTD